MDKNQLNIFLFLFFTAVCSTGFGIIGCGIKNPPLPPLKELPNAVTDLEKTVTGSIIILEWSIPPKKDRAVIERFCVFRSKTGPKTGTDEHCPGCPLKFKKIADINVGSDLWQGGEKEKVSYSEGLETGSRYSYKIVGYTWDNVASADSNLIEFDF
ncbi:MAG: hypothetical protein JRI91_01430 [Deltaproteobacteria bacterium]|nr:hypothetical protein [Deltaproteobacteria bacterium]